MAPSLTDNLPDALKSGSTRPLFVTRLDVRTMLIVGATPGAFRRIGVVPGGSFAGERLSGEVLDGGSDWQVVRNDGATRLNVRLVLKTDDDALICMTYQGVRHGPPDVVDKSKRARKLIRLRITFASIHCSRPPRRNTTVLIASSRLASVIGKPRARLTVSSKCCETRAHGKEIFEVPAMSPRTRWIPKIIN